MRANLRREKMRQKEFESADATGTRLTTRVKAPEEEHTVTVSKVLSWLDGDGARSPSEQVKKKRLGERLRA
jgi:hypothetical protein